jgi:tetratricopeptide (TPR) repeat protein
MNLGETLSRAGALDQALSLACEALALAREHGQRGVEGWGLRLLAEIAAHRDPPRVTESEEYYGQALGLAEPRGMQPFVARCHLGLGTLYRKSGVPEKARTELTTAAGLLRSMEMTFWVAQAEEELRAL